MLMMEMTSIQGCQSLGRSVKITTVSAMLRAMRIQLIRLNFATGDFRSCIDLWEK